MLATSHQAIAVGQPRLPRRGAGGAPAVRSRSRCSRSARSAACVGRLKAIAFAARAGYHLAAARAFVVDDYFFPMYVIRPRPGTVRLQVWHAAGAFKKFGYSVLGRSFGADEAFVRRVAIHGNYSLALVSSMAVAPHYAEAFGQPVDLFTSRLGLPRTDLFADPARRDRALARLRATYGLPDGRRIVLYAPTFRGDTVGKARYDDLLDLRVMHDVLGDDHAVLLKLHPFVRTALEIPPELAAFAIDASADPDLNELMLVADVLVTDYSSAMYEFALLGRPIAFLAPDAECVSRRARLLPRLSRGPAGAGVRDDGRAGGGDPGRRVRPRAGARVRGGVVRRGGRALDRAHRRRGAAARARRRAGRGRSARVGAPARSGRRQVPAAAAISADAILRSRQPTQAVEARGDRQPRDEDPAEDDPADDQADDLAGLVEGVDARRRGPRSSRRSAGPRR